MPNRKGLKSSDKGKQWHLCHSIIGKIIPGEGKWPQGHNFMIMGAFKHYNPIFFKN
jgi:hypothetical protein